MSASGSRIPERVESRPPGRFAALAQSVSRWSDAHPLILFAALSVWYVALIWTQIRRPLWFDELSTYYIAQQPTVARMMEAIRSIDLNPPLNYFLARWSIAAFGPSPWATRLPGAIAFWGGSAAIFELLRRRASSLIAAIGVLLFWCSPYFPYAAEARPYGLLLGLTAILLAAWDSASDRRGWSSVLAILVSGSLLLLSHIFGTLSLGAVWIGEAARSTRRRETDWPVVAALLLPLFATITYRPMFHVYGAAVFPPDSQATWGKLYYLYFAVFRWMWRPLVALALFAFFFRVKERATDAQPNAAGMRTALALLFLIPVGVILIFMRSHGAFYDRYGMAMVLPIVLIAPLLLQRATGAQAAASFGALCAVAVLLLFSTALRAPLAHAASSVMPPRAANRATTLLTTSTHGPFRPWWKKLPVPDELLKERAQAPLLQSLDNFHPDLPLVAGDELTFLEMDNRESDALTRRLFYLYDRRAEVEIGRRTAANGMLDVRRFFPIRAAIAPYETFVQQHNSFLVIGLYEHSGDWLLRKLEQDGATLQVVAQHEGYTDTDIYLVSFPQK